MELVWLGVVLTLLSTFGMTLGVFLTKAYHNAKTQNKQGNEEPQAQLMDLPRPDSDVLSDTTSSELIDIDTDLEEESIEESKKLHWVVPVLVLSVSTAVNFLSFAFAPQTLLTSLSSSQFVWNLFFARTILKEVVSIREVAAVLLIIVGNVTVVFASSSSTTSLYSIQQLGRLAIRPLYLGYLAVVALIALFSEFIFRKHKLQSRFGPTAAQICYCLFSAIVGSQSIPLTKSISIVLIGAFVKALKSPIFWVFLVLVIMLIGTWVYRVNNALKIFTDSVSIIPLLQVFWLTFSVLTGGIFFEEFERMSGQELAMFTLGLTIILGSVIWLLFARSVESKKERSKSEFVSVLLCEELSKRAEQVYELSKRESVI
jgi:hypothetical protein